LSLTSILLQSGTTGPVTTNGAGEAGAPSVTVQLTIPASHIINADGSKKKTSKGDSTVITDPCFYRVVANVKAGDVFGTTTYHEAGAVYSVSCPDAINISTGRTIFATMGYVFAATGVAPVAPPPDPGLLAQQALAQMTVPNPVIHFGPDPTQVAVKIPVQLWIDNPGPMSVTVTVRGLSVTATAVITSTTFTMGEPADAHQQGSAPADPLTCTGAGNPTPTPGATAGSGTDAATCRYTYQWQSTADRTAGTAKWPVTAVANWTVTWTATNGAGGTLTQPLTPTQTTNLEVGEWRSVLVAGPGG